MAGRRGGLALVTADGDAPFSPGPALFEEMLAGWRRQQQARSLTGPLIEGRVRLARRFSVLPRPSKGARVRTCCGTSVLYGYRC